MLKKSRSDCVITRNFKNVVIVSSIFIILETLYNFGEAFMFRQVGWLNRNNLVAPNIASVGKENFDKIFIFYLVSCK